MEFIKNRQEKGFLLIDALIGMVILTIALITIVGTITSATRLSSANDDLTQANKLAQSSIEKLKQIKASTWKELIKVSDTDYAIGSSIGNVTLPPSTNKFICTNSARMVSTMATGTHLVEVRSQITWTSITQTGTTENHNVMLRTYCERQED